MGYGVTGYEFMDAQLPRVLVETGIVGLAAFLYLIWAVFKMAFTNLKRVQTPVFKGLIIGFICGYIGLLFHSLSEHFSHRPHIELSGSSRGWLPFCLHWRKFLRMQGMYLPRIPDLPCPACVKVGKLEAAASKALDLKTANRYAFILIYTFINFGWNLMKYP